MDDACLDGLELAGATMVPPSAWESLSDRLLKAIGRSHDAKAAENGVRRAAARGFGSVNVDLMFALPGQTPEELDSDLRRILALDIQQLSTYPMFGFPYTELGRKRGLAEITRPDARRIRKMLPDHRRPLPEAGLERWRGLVVPQARPQEIQFGDKAPLPGNWARARRP